MPHRFQRAAPVLCLVAAGWLAACAAPTPLPGVFDTALAGTVSSGSTAIAQRLGDQLTTLTAAAPAPSQTAPAPTIVSASATAAATVTPLPSATAAPSATSSGTPAPAAKATATFRAAPTQPPAAPSNTPASAALQPGTYPLAGVCTTSNPIIPGANVGFGRPNPIRFTICVPSVVVRATGELQVNVTWVSALQPGGLGWTGDIPLPAYNGSTLYLEDELGALFTDGIGGGAARWGQRRAGQRFFGLLSLSRAPAGRVGVHARGYPARIHPRQYSPAMITAGLARRSRPLMSLLLGAALVGLSGCAGAPATLDVAQLAAAAQATLQIVGTHAALAATQTATAWRPTATSMASASPASPLTGTASPTAAASFTAAASSTVADSATPTVTLAPTPALTGTVKTAASLRAGPGLIYPGMAKVTAGEPVVPLGQTVAGDWYLLQVAGSSGWLAKTNVRLYGDASGLPVITDLPPTPTRPPATVTPLATPTPLASATPVPPAFACNVSVQASQFKGYIILTGSGWPPDVDVSLSVNASFGTTFNFPNVARTGGPQSQTPYAFWKTIPDPIGEGATGAFTFSGGGCVKAVNWP